MKVFAESQPPRDVPFLHLGYLAVKMLKPATGFVESGLLFAFIGVLLAFRVVKSAIVFRKTKIARVGAIMLFMGILLCYLGFQFGKFVPTHGKSLTRIKMMSLDSELFGLFEQSESAKKTLPGPGTYDLSTVISNLPDFHQRRTIRDAWEQTMKMEIVAETNGFRFTLISSGSDGKFGTKDDISFEMKKTEEALKAQ